MLYKLTLPANFFQEKLNTELLVRIVRGLRPLGIELHFGIVGLELIVTNANNDMTDKDVLMMYKRIKVEFDKHTI